MEPNNKKIMQPKFIESIKHWYLQTNQDLSSHDVVNKYFGLLVICAITPFAINEFNQGHYYIFLLESLAVLLIITDIIYTKVFGSSSLIRFLNLSGLGLVLWFMVYQKGVIGIYWSYPYVVLLHYVIRSRGATAINIVFVLGMAPLAYLAVGEAETYRVLVTLALSSLVANIFSFFAEKQQELFQQKSEEKFSSAFNSSPNAMSITRVRDNIILEVNDKFCEGSGYMVDDAVGKSMPELDVWVDLEQRNHYLEMIKQQGNCPGLEVIFKHKDGRLIDSLLSGSLIEVDGEPCVFSNALIITERKQAERQLHENEERFSFMLDNCPLAVRIAKNIEQEIVYANSTYGELVNSSHDQIIGSNLGSYYVDIKDYDDILEQIDQGNKIDNHQMKLVIPDIGTKWVLASYLPIQYKGEPAVLAWFFDITASKHADEELHKLSRAVEASTSAVVITDLDGNIEYVNSKFTEITGYSSEEVIGRNPSLLKSGEIPDEVYADLWKSISSGGEWKGELHNKKKDGTFYWARDAISAVKNTEGEITHFMAIQDDVTHEFEMTEQLSYQASHDLLTGLTNRREFERRAERLLSTIRQDKDEHALCFLDLDQFKVVNDTCGHTAGDELLRQLGNILQDAVRHRDTLARLGGDEFGVLMEHCSLEHAHRVATALKEAVWDFQFVWEGQSFRVGVSIGLVAITEATTDLTELLKHADAACYMAKDLGRNRIHVYQLDDTELAERHGEMQWVARIYKALEEKRFRLYAQPIVPLDGGEAPHYELLIRMEDEEGRMVPPGAFLPAAERYNLITIIDDWVIDEAFKFLENHPAFLKRLGHFAINLSGLSLTDSNFQDFVVKKFMNASIPPGKICFEITETAAISNLSSATIFISKMKILGCRFSLDDFGSGLSSFGYLKNLNVDYLKIDGMFVKDIVDDPIDHAMVKSINEIGQIMGLQTIAEFVENDQIRTILNDIGVNYVQGYGIAKPMPINDILD